MVQLDRHLFEIAGAMSELAATRAGCLVALTLTVPPQLQGTSIPESLRRELAAVGLGHVVVSCVVGKGTVRVRTAEFKHD